MKVLLVDLDDTLLDYSGGVDECWTAACETVASPAGIDTVLLIESVRKERRLFWDDPERHRRERVDMPGAWRKIVARGLERMGAPDAVLAGPVAEDFAARRWAMMRLFPGVPEALGKLRGSGVVMALVTNGDTRQQRAKIERYDLGGYFDLIQIEGEFGAGKPEEIVYRHVLQRLGLRGVWVDREGAGLTPGSAVRPDRIIREFPEILAH